MKHILVGLVALLVSSCAGHVEPAPEPPPRQQEQTLKEAFCSMAEQQMAQNELVARAKAAESGLSLKIKITECDLVNESAGRIYYTLSTTMGEQPVLTLDAIAIIVRMDGGWAVVKDVPIYTMDHVRGEFSWFVNEPVDDSRGQDI
jgi:hypothetical protein